MVEEEEQEDEQEEVACVLDWGEAMEFSIQNSVVQRERLVPLKISCVKVILCKDQINNV